MASLPPRHKSFIFLSFIVIFIFLLRLPSCPVVTAQQAYTRYTCGRRNSTKSLGYICNGVNTTCGTYLIYIAQPSYNNVTAIAHLLNANATEITNINNITSSTSPLATGKELIIPITCTCAGNFYQSNASFVVRASYYPYRIAHDVFEGLTTCAAIQNQRNKADQQIQDMFPGENLTIPIRCACPTKKQAEDGVKYLLTYVVQKGSAISSIAVRFGASVGMTLQANNKSEEDSLIDYPSTLLVPLQAPPKQSQTRTRKPSWMSPSPPPPVPAPPPVSSGRSNNKSTKWVFLVLGVVGGGAFMLIIGVAAGMCLVVKQRRKTAKLSLAGAHDENQTTKKSAQKLADLENIIPSIAQSLKVYSYEELESATENFSHSSWISGSVYVGTINERKVAIKRTDADVAREIEILNKINHSNLISLLGVAYKQGEWYLIYEYASNGSVSDWIFRKVGAEDGGQKKKILSWVQRIQIALDVATGVDYLHSYTCPPQVHRDLRCSHVLLDGEFRAKISHFALSRPVGQETGQQFALTNHIIGTKGYMAPEYLEDGLVTTKLDVYAFGVLLVEMMTGKEVVDLLSGENVYLSDVLETVINDETDGYERFMDPALKENYPMDVAYMMTQLAQRCVRKDPNSRPGMEEIVRFLAKTMTTTMILEASANSFTISSEITGRP